MEYYSAIRKNNYPTFAATWMDLEEIVLNEICQAEKDNYHMVSRAWGVGRGRKLEKRGKGRGGKQEGGMKYESETMDSEKQTEGFRGEEGGEMG